MEHAAKLFAIRVLLLHALAFVLLLILTGIGVHNAYRRAQEQAIDQAGMRQHLVAQQTARGIENYFAAVRDNIRLLTRAEMQEIGPILPNRLPVPQPPSGIGSELRERLITQAAHAPDRIASSPILKAVWKQVDTRISHLIAFRVNDGTIIDSEQREDAVACDDLLPSILHAVRDGGIEGVSNRIEVSGFAFSCVWVRFSNTDPHYVAAVIPLDLLGKQFIDPLNDAGQRVGAALYDGNTVVVRTVDPEMMGVNLEKDSVTPGFRRLVGAQRARPTGGIERVENIEFIKGQVIEQGIVAFEPIRLAERSVWYVSIGSTQADASSLVKEIFAGTLFWAPILLLVFTSVMVSTAITLIRNRSRLERFRHQMLSNELAQARQIQLSWLPQTRFQGRGLDVLALNTPASHVSGDFYNYFPLRDGREVVVIGDVTGHGLAAAFLMATTQMLIRATLTRTGDPVATLDEVNHELCSQAFSGQFVTLLLAVIDQESGSIDVINAGHPPPIIVDDGAVQMLRTRPQLVLGVEGDTKYYVQNFPLPDTECTILLYTDGIVECRNPQGERFSMDKLCTALSGASEIPDELMARVMRIVDDFRGTEPLTDDATAVAMRITSIDTPARANFVGAQV